MSFLKNIFKKNDEPIRSYDDFWRWFEKNESAFFKVVKEKGDVQKEFFDKLSPKLKELKDGFYFLVGMLNADTVELVLTADGEIKNIPFVEELVNAAPLINGWAFTALKPPLTDISKVHIEMSGYKFNSENINFYANDLPDYPDEIAITVVYDDLNEQNKTLVTNGVYIFLDNFLGELNFAASIDTMKVIGKAEALKELVPIGKLKDFLIWREKEFIEKYEGVRYNIEDDSYAMLEAELDNGNPLLAIINSDLLEWDKKASHPWIVITKIKYDGTKNNGMPDNKTYKLMDELEQEIQKALKDFDGYLNIGRQTAEGERDIYLACREFRKPSGVIYKLKQQYADKLDLDYEIYRDKYWQSFNRFISQ